jgi:hypothetical protein
MSNGRRKLGALAAALAVVGVMLSGAPATPADRTLDDLLFDLQLVPLEGKTPPPFELERLGDGQKVTLASQKGQALFLYFWATW